MQTITYTMRIERLSPGSPAAAMITPAQQPNGYVYGDERLLTVIGARLTQRQVWARVEQYVHAQWPEDTRPIRGQSYIGKCRVTGEQVASPRVRSQAARLGYREGVCAWCRRQASTLRFVSAAVEGWVCKECRGVPEGVEESL